MFISNIKINQNIELESHREDHKNRFKVKSKSYWHTFRNKPIYDEKHHRRIKGYEKEKRTSKSFVLFEKGFSINFKDNLTIIVGENGTGKTSFFKHTLNLSILNHSPLFDKLNATQRIKKNFDEFRNNMISTITFNRLPERFVVGDNIHKNSFVDEFKASKAVLSPSDVVNLWDMQASSNGENTLDFLKAISEIKDSFILLDEPETSLSIKSIAKLRETLLKLTESNQVIIITHNEKLMKLANEIYDFNSKKYINTDQYIKMQEV